MYSYAQCALQVSRPNGGHGTDPVNWNRTFPARTWTNGTCPTLEIACERQFNNPRYDYLRSLILYEDNYHNRTGLDTPKPFSLVLRTALVHIPFLCSESLPTEDML